ncbi:MAG: methyltransferase domain-containing protein [Geminicoccaceae bacterium]
MTSEGAISLHGFTEADHGTAFQAYVDALEAFDALGELQELKVLARERTGTGSGRDVLDVGCGFGLETPRLAAAVRTGGKVSGIDKSEEFVALAQRRATAAGLEIELRTGDAQALPYPDHGFDIVRAERVMVYLPDPARALAEMRRVAKPGGRIAIIEPDFGTNVINVPDRALVRAVLDHECDANVPQGWLVRDLPAMLGDQGFRDVEVATRIVRFTPELAVGYFTQTGRSALQAGVIDAAGLERWTSAIAGLAARGRLSAAIGYYLLTATA